MKHLMAIAALALLATSAFSQGVPGNGVVLGERTVRFQAERDVIPVGGYEGAFKEIFFWVERNNIELFNLVVTYGDGQREKIGTRLVFDEGTRSRVIHLEGFRRRISSIAFQYRTAGNWLEGRARVVVYGIR
jgi:hypothetical protein